MDAVNNVVESLDNNLSYKTNLNINKHTKNSIKNFKNLKQIVTVRKNKSVDN